MHLRRVCVFCGSNFGNRLAYRETAEHTARLLVKRGIELVYGGANVGLMKVLADTVLASGGRVLGVMPESLIAREVGHPSLTQLHIVSSMHERKAKMADLSDGFVAMPGGYGTFEEFCEIVTWAQLGIHAKPCGLLDVEGYYAPLLAMFDRAVEEGFVRPANRRLVLDDPDPARLLNKMETFEPVPVAKWIDSGER